MESRVTITGICSVFTALLLHDTGSQVGAGFYCSTISYIGDAGSVNKQK